MKLTGFPKTIFCLAILLCMGNGARLATAQTGVGFTEFLFVAINSPTQTVEVDTPRGSYSADFESQARVFPNGDANGFLMLSGPDSIPRHPGGVNMLFGDGSVRFHPDGTVARVLLRGSTIEGHPIVVMITPEASEDCLIYTTIGTQLYPSTWEVPGTINVIR